MTTLKLEQEIKKLNKGLKPSKKDLAKIPNAKASDLEQAQRKLKQHQDKVNHLKANGLVEGVHFRVNNNEVWPAKKYLYFNSIQDEDGWSKKYHYLSTDFNDYYNIEFIIYNIITTEEVETGNYNTKKVDVEPYIKEDVLSNVNIDYDNKISCYWLWFDYRLRSAKSLLDKLRENHESRFVKLENATEHYNERIKKQQTRDLFKELMLPAIQEVIDPVGKYEFDFYRYKFDIKFDKTTYSFEYSLSEDNVFSLKLNSIFGAEYHTPDDIAQVLKIQYITKDVEVTK